MPVDNDDDVGDFTVLGKTFDLNVETPFVTISQEDLDKYLSSSTPGPIPSKKRKFDGDNADLSSGWLPNLFSNMAASTKPNLQLLNWKYRDVDGRLRLCVTISDGTHATKQATIAEHLVEKIKEAPLYSIITVNSGSILTAVFLALMILN